MIFADCPLDQAEGAILAHSIPLWDTRLRKGLVLGPSEIEALREAGLDTVTVARLETHDVGEDDAATRVARAMVPDPSEAFVRVGRASTGRVNIHAVGPGVAAFDAQAIARANLIDPMITVATVPQFARVWDRALLATVKIISYGVPRASLREVEAILADAFRVRPVIMRSATLIETVIGDGGPTKGEAAIRARLERMGMDLCEVVHVPHEVNPLAAAIAEAQGDIVLVLTASATSDLRDTAPEALRQAGGQVTRFGMPVDPGNLLFTGGLGAVPVIGLPGCARSPALNGADWVLERVVCGIDVTDRDIAAMGVGGLLKEIPQRGRPRE